MHGCERKIRTGKGKGESRKGKKGTEKRKEKMTQVKGKGEVIGKESRTIKGREAGYMGKVKVRD